MPEVLKELLAHQFEAALCTLHVAFTRCTDAEWGQPVANLKYCQVAFHTVFFVDVYLQPSDDVRALKGQEFHVEHAAHFRDYEEMEDRAQVLTYERAFVYDYLAFVRRKAQRTIERETPGMLAGPSGFARRTCSRAELHVYNIRHIQHHAAQLSLRLRLNRGVDIPWMSHSWKDDV